jgi:hypothetical protein
MNIALRFAMTCARAYRRASDHTRKLYNAAVLDRVLIRDGRIVEAAYHEPFDGLFAVPKFEYETVVGRRGLEPLTPCASCKCATNCANGPQQATLVHCQRGTRRVRSGGPIPG